MGPSPLGTPTSARPGIDFRAYFIEEILLGIVKSFISNFFQTPRHLGGALRALLKLQNYFGHLNTLVLTLEK